MVNYFEAGRKALIVVGLIFIANGLVILGLRWGKVIPSPPLPVVAGPVFLLLGAVGMASAYFGLRTARVWAWSTNALIYVPWTVRGLRSDLRQGLWPLVLGESLGLVVIALALIATAGRVFHARR